MTGRPGRRLLLLAVVTVFRAWFAVCVPLSGDEAYHWLWIPILGYAMALGVGLSVRYLGEPGDLSYTVQCVHDQVRTK